MFIICGVLLMGLNFSLYNFFFICVFFFICGRNQARRIRGGGGGGGGGAEGADFSPLIFFLLSNLAFLLQSVVSSRQLR